MSNDNRLHQQWMSRPNDQRFLSLADLAASVASRKSRSVEFNLTDPEVTIVGEDLQIKGARGTAAMTHWSFGQMCRLSKAPSDYLRTLPPVLAAANLQWSLEKRQDRGEPVKILATCDTSGSSVECRAITSATYGRVWDSEVVTALQRLGTDWHVPAASYSATDPLRATTLYASDRDIFIFLCRDEAIEIGSGQALHRGIMAWNSEVGSASFGLATFTYDRLCDNRIIWGVSDKIELRIRHTSGAPARIVREVQPMLAAYVQEDSKKIASTVQAAKACQVGTDKDSVITWMMKRGFNKSQSNAAYTSAERDSRKQGLNPRSLWGLVQGATDYAHEIAHTDTRVEIERAAGALLDNVAA